MDTLLLFQPSIFQRDGDFTFLPKLYLINLKGYQIEHYDKVYFYDRCPFDSPANQASRKNVPSLTYGALINSLSTFYGYLIFRYNFLIRLV